MRSEQFSGLLDDKWRENKFLCVGLDSNLEKIPATVRKDSIRETILAFNKAIIDATADLVCAYKPNSAFYEAYGEEGWQALRETVSYIHDRRADVPVILDAKRGDIGSTNEAYAEAIFTYLEVDAVTLHPYTGKEGLQPFLERPEKGAFILCRTSNPGSGEFQDLTVDGDALYKRVARNVSTRWNEHGNCGLVVGATYPEEMSEVRSIAPRLPFLVPGIGAQQGDIESTVQKGKNETGGLIISASRSVIFASSGQDFAEAARTETERLSGEIREAIVK